MASYFLKHFLAIALLGAVLIGTAEGQESHGKLPELGDALTDEQVSDFAGLALKGMDQEYPNKPSNVMAGPESVQSPQEMHPAFYGCFDWHSSVHGHWMLVRLIRLHPDHPQVDEIRQRLANHLTMEKLEKEAEYFRAPHNRLFERMYGWAWLFRLVAELEEWNDEQGNQWRENLRPLEEILAERVREYLPKLTYPIRTGVHPNTAFAMGQILDYAQVTGQEDLIQLIQQRARDYYLNDKAYPANYEPSGQDFFSASLNEADLMRRILTPAEFSEWLTEFLPTLGTDPNHALLQPVEVSDVEDGKIVHLAGLDLSRAWCFLGIAGALDDNDPRKKIVLDAAAAHARLGFRYVFSGSYEGEHWLATFAIYTLTRVGVDTP